MKRIKGMTYLGLRAQGFNPVYFKGFNPIFFVLIARPIRLFFFEF